MRRGQTLYKNGAEKRIFMSTTQPIREKEGLKKFMNYYKDMQPSPRNHALVIFGLHTALRISDILHLRWNQVYDFEHKCFLTHLYLEEHKTGKQNVIALHPFLTEILNFYHESRKNVTPADFLFTKTTNYSAPLSRSQAFRIIRHAAQECLPENTNISCHSLRKTFGYHAWKQGIPPALLMDIYNHSSYKITKRYLGIEQDERDSVFAEIEFF